MPAFADEFLDSQSAESLDAFGEAVGDEVAEMYSQLAMAVVVVTLNAGFLNGSDAVLDLPVDSRMIWGRDKARCSMPCPRQLQSKE